MTAANHVLAGAIIGATIHQPLIALPLAFISHFILDVVPHFGFKNWEERSGYKNLLNNIIKIDGALLFIIAIWLLLLSPGWLVLVSGFVAASPDLAWIYRFTIKEKFGQLPPQPCNWLTNFHASIQVFEFRQGLVIEYPVMLLFVWLLNMKVK